MTLWNKCQQAASYLDHKYPNWWEKIDLNRLNLEKSKDCICGQIRDKPLYFYYWRGQIDIMVGEYKECFYYLKSKSIGEEGEYYKKLTKYWKTLTKQRKEKDNAN